MDTNDTAIQNAECETQTDPVMPFVALPVARCSKSERFALENAL